MIIQFNHRIRIMQTHLCNIISMQMVSNSNFMHQFRQTTKLWWNSEYGRSFTFSALNCITQVNNFSQYFDVFFHLKTVIFNTIRALRSIFIKFSNFSIMLIVHRAHYSVLILIEKTLLTITKWNNSYFAIKKGKHDSPIVYQHL